jgi:hypothetical protein
MFTISSIIFSQINQSQQHHLPLYHPLTFLIVQNTKLASYPKNAPYTTKCITAPFFSMASSSPLA